MSGLNLGALVLAVLHRGGNGVASSVSAFCQLLSLISQVTGIGLFGADHRTRKFWRQLPSEAGGRWWVEGGDRGKQPRSSERTIPIGGYVLFSIPHSRK